MATLNPANRKSYFLSVTPVDYSLTAGTNIPPPPPDSPAQYSPIEPPTPGGGPLTSHPSHPVTPSNEAESEADYSTMPSAAYSHFNHSSRERETERERTDSFRTTTTTPTSGLQPPPSSSSPQDPRRAGGVRRLFSLTNLRSSFSSSRTSLSLPRQSHDPYGHGHPNGVTNGVPNGVKRPSSPSMASTTASSTTDAYPPGNPQGKPQLRHRKSGGNWFKRKSSMFLNGDLEAVEENQRPPPGSREGKRVKENGEAGEARDAGWEIEGSGVRGIVAEREMGPPRVAGPPPPLLPEIGSLRGGRISGVGDLGWDEGAFKR